MRRLVSVNLLVIIAVAAGVLAAQSQSGWSAAPTPRMPDGKPDLSGVWGAGGGGGGRDLVELEPGKLVEEFPSRRCGPTQVNCGDYTNQSEDGEFTARMKDGGLPFEEIRKMAVEEKAVERAMAKARGYIDSALENLREIPESVYRQSLEQLAHHCIERVR